MQAHSTNRPTPRWVHLLAILTVVAALPLLVVGGLVTTFRVGMADPDWPTTPWFLFFVSWTEPRPGYLIEHSHRLAGYILGCFAIVLAIAVWRTAMGRPRWLGIACLIGVTLQGLLGGFRVRLNALVGTDLAAIHGIFAQLVFSLLVSAAVLTGPRSARCGMHPDERKRCRKLALLLVGLVFLQLIWGALVRHNPTAVAQRLHLITAFIVVAAAIWLIKTAHEAATSWHELRRPCVLLAIFLLLQVVLGVESWMGKFATGVLPDLEKITTGQAIVRTAHVLVGTGILATAVAAALLTRRPRSIEQEEPKIAPDGPWMAEASGSHQPGVAT